MNHIDGLLELINMTFDTASGHLGRIDGESSRGVRIMTIDAHGNTGAICLWSQCVSLIELNRCLSPVALITRLGKFHGERSGVGNNQLGMRIPSDIDVAVGTLDTRRRVLGRGVRIAVDLKLELFAGLECHGGGVVLVATQA